MTAVSMFVAAAAGFAAAALFVALAPGGRRTQPAVLILVAGAAGVVAAFAPPEATGLLAVDAALRALTAATATALGARAARPALAVAAVVVAVGSTGGDWAWPAAAAAGAAVALLTARVHRRWLRAVVAGVVSVAAFHLAWPEPSLGTASLAAVALVVLVASGVTRLRRRPRRRALVAFGLVGGALIVAGGAGAAAAVLARSDVEAGVRDAQRGLAAARRGDAAGAAAAFDRARTSFAAAHGALDAWWARPALIAPVVSRHTRALVTLTDTGADIAAAGGRLAVTSDPATLKVDAGRVPLSPLRALGVSAEEALAVVKAADAELDDLASPWLVPPVRDRLDDLHARVERAVRDIGRLAAGTRLAPAMLGGDGPRRYLLVIQTPAEQRATGGFIGSFAEVAADGGAVSLERLGRTRDLNTGGARVRQVEAPPDYLDRYSRFDPDELWQNVNMSPDFPTVARVIEHLYPQSGGQAVDGVLAVDPHGLAALLGVVGPVRVPEWPEPITAENATRVLLFEQYVRFEGDERVDFLATVTDAVWRKLLTSSLDVVALGRALGDAVAEKHILVAASRPEEQRLLTALDVSGAVAPVDGDFLAVVNQNAGGNKIDWFLRKRVDYRAEVDPATGAVAATVRVTLRNEAPAGGLPAYIIGSALRPPLPTGTNRTYVSVYSPWLLRDATVDGRATALESERELGRHVYSAFVDIPPGGAVVLELQLTGELAGQPYRLDLHRQASPVPDEVHVTVAVPGRPEVRRQYALVRDRRLTVPE